MDHDHVVTEYEVGSRRSDRKPTSHLSSKGLGGAILGVVLFVLLLAFVAWWLWPRPVTKNVIGPNQKATEPVNAPLIQEEVPRDARFVQKDVGWSGRNRVIEGGLTAEGDSPAEITAYQLKLAGHEARALAAWAYGAGLWKNPNNYKPLLTPDRKYLSQKGIELWHSLKGAWTAKGTKTEIGQAPANAYNSGVNSKGTYGRSRKRGISGNRTSIIRTYRDGSKQITLLRCGNDVFIIITNLPRVPTDNPKPCPKNCDRKLAEQPVQENVAPPTPGVTRGEPERTKASQDVNANNPNPVPGGKTGQADNNTTTRPDGEVESSPKYPVNPDPPPPKNDVPDGGILGIVE